MLHKEIPFIRLLVPLCVGILTGYLTDLPLSAALFLLGFAGILLVVSFFLPTLVTNHLYGAALSMLIMASGFSLLRYELAKPEIIKNTEAVFVCRIKSFPEPKANSYAIMVDMNGRVDEDGILQKVTGGLMIYHSTSDSAAPSMIPGDILVIRTRLIPITNRGNPYEFDYQKFMLKKGVRYFAFTRETSIIQHHPGTRLNIRDKALITGKKISYFFRSAGIEEKNAALLSGFILGQKDRIDEDTYLDFSRAGVMHIMSVSGLHAGVISVFVFSLLFFMRGRLNFLRVFISVGVLWTFAFITGLSAPVIRASLMFTFLHSGKLLKRPVNSINSILSAAFFMLIFNPSDLTSLGFQLSFTAVLFISGFYSRFSGLFRSGIWPLDKAWQSAVVSVLAQLGTTPFVLNAFGQFPTWFLPANLIIIPLTTAIIILAFVMIILAPIGLFNGLFSWALNFLLEITSKCAGIFSDLPGSAELGRVLLWPETIALFVLIWAFLYYIFYMRDKNLKVTIIAVLVLMSVSTFRYFRTGTTSEIIIYNQTNTITLGFRSGHKIWIYSENEEPDQAVSRHVSALGLKARPASLKSLPSIIEFKDYRLLLMAQYSADIIHKNNPDILITKEIPKMFVPPDTDNNMVILVTSGSANVIIITNDDSLVRNTDVYFLPEYGAHIIDTHQDRKNE